MCVHPSWGVANTSQMPASAKHRCVDVLLASPLQMKPVFSSLRRESLSDMSDSCVNRLQHMSVLSCVYYVSVANEAASARNVRPLVMSRLECGLASGPANCATLQSPAIAQGESIVRRIDYSRPDNYYIISSSGVQKCNVFFCYFLRGRRM